MRRLATALLACSLPALAGHCPLAAQARDTTLLGPGRADLLTGLYILEDGRLVHVTDLRDQLRNEPTISATEYASGRARALFPREGAFVAGNAWFRWDSIAYRVRFDETGGPVGTLRWEEGGRVLAGRRAPLRELEVTIPGGDVRLAGVLVLPPGPGPHPAMVMVPGSGPETRRIPRQLGDLVAYRGVAVLVTDKRGTGGSTGQWNGLSHADWAADVEAQLDFLRARPEIDPARIGLMGSSEGGYVAPVVAARRPDVRFLVCRVCAALPHAAVIPDIETTSRRARGMAEADVAGARELVERMIRYALERTGYDSLVAHAASGLGRPWRETFPVREIPPAAAPYWDAYRGVLTVDPMTHYAHLAIPTLVVLGERDDRILIDRHRPLFESLAARPDFTLRVVPAAAHGLMLGPNNSLGYPPGLHDWLADWIVRAAGGERGPAPDPHPEWESAFIEANGIRLHYWRTGGAGKPVIVMAHGITDFGLNWTGLAERLQADYDVVMYDARGHGYSDQPAGPYDLASHVADLVGLVRGLGLERPVLMGHSMGGATVALAAATHPDLARAIILEDPADMLARTEPLRPEIIPDWKQMVVDDRNTELAALMEHARTVRHPGWRDIDYRLWAQSKRLVHPNVVDILNGQGFGDAGVTYPLVNAPALILKADADSAGRARHQEIAGLLPHGRLVHIDGAGHVIRNDRPDATEREIRAFLAGLPR